jgi:hypothetical protein
MDIQFVGLIVSIIIIQFIIIYTLFNHIANKITSSVINAFPKDNP